MDHFAVAHYSIAGGTPSLYLSILIKENWCRSRVPKIQETGLAVQGTNPPMENIDYAYVRLTLVCIKKRNIGLIPIEN